MLARTPKSLVYLSADELGITSAERAGLIEVRDDLASGRVKHARLQPTTEDNWFYATHPDAENFNMAEWDGVTDCGTAHCIGGFMRARGCFGDHGFTAPMHDLFYPTRGMLPDLTPSQAVLAIDHFLAGASSDCWPLALADEPA